MKEEAMREYQARLTTAAEAVKCVKSGDNVFIGTCSSAAGDLCDALADRKDEIRDLTVSCSLVLKPLRLLRGEIEGFRLNTFFVWPQERSAIDRGQGDFTSVHLREIPIWCH